MKKTLFMSWRRSAIKEVNDWALCHFQDWLQRYLQWFQQKVRIDCICIFELLKFFRSVLLRKRQHDIFYQIPLLFFLYKFFTLAVKKLDNLLSHRRHIIPTSVGLNLVRSLEFFWRFEVRFWWTDLGIYEVRFILMAKMTNFYTFFDSLFSKIRGLVRFWERFIKVREQI